jgi:protein-L-isoaspartate(D-aspartate) O-methyltransferase
MHAAAAESLLPFLHPGARVLDVGSGSGYLTHVLANLVGSEGRVIGVDHIQELVDLARKNMGKSPEGRDMLEKGQVVFVKADGRKGWNYAAPYDAIHVGAAAVEAHAPLIEQLKAPGRFVDLSPSPPPPGLESLLCSADVETNNRMFIPVGSSGLQHIWVIDKKEDGSVEREKTFGVSYVPLTDAP